jgi:hypothetical protein
MKKLILLSTFLFSFVIQAQVKTTVDVTITDVTCETCDDAKVNLGLLSRKANYFFFGPTKRIFGTTSDEQAQSLSFGYTLKDFKPGDYSLLVKDNLRQDDSGLLVPIIYFRIRPFSEIPVIPDCSVSLKPELFKDGKYQDLSGNLSWNATTSGNPTGYLLTLGTNLFSDNIVYKLNVGNVTSYNVAGLLPNTTYGIVITPYNANGYKQDCSVFKFTTRDALPLNLTAAIIKTIPCYGSNEAEIFATATGGSGLYQFSINGVINQNFGFFSNLREGNYTINVMDVVSNESSSLNVNIASPKPIIISPTISNLTATINTSGGTPPYTYSYSKDGVAGVPSTSNSVTFPSPGTLTVSIQDANGCQTITNPLILSVNAPLINNKTTATVNLSSGSKLKNIVIDGAPIVKWYSNPGTSTAKLKQTSKLSAETDLDPETTLENGKTYYASQIIDGFESTQRLAVTVTLGTLSNEDFVLTDFKYYPNPVKNTLSVSNSAIIDEISITSVLGKTIMTKKINSLKSDIDMSNLSTGIYFLKVKSEGKEKTVKLLK